MADSAEDLTFVQFDDLDEFYLSGVDISPSYVVPLSFTASSRDWIGLYKVGWRSSKEYYTFEWAPVVQSEDRRVAVTFQKRRLPPSDDSTFYQFCYVARDGSVRAVSSTFQICNQPIGGVDEDDLECLEIDDNDLSSIMVVRSKNQEVEKELLRAKEETSKLKSMHQLVETEREALKEQLAHTETEKESLVLRVEEATSQQEKLQEELKRKLAERSEVAVQLEERAERVKDLEKQVQVLNERLDESSQTNDDLRKKLGEEQKQIGAFAVKLHDSEQEIQLLQASLEATQQQMSQLKTSYEVKDNESDIFKQRIYDLQKENEAMTIRLTDSEAKLQETTAVNLQLNDELAQRNFECADLRSRLDDAQTTQLEHEKLSRLHADQLTMKLTDVNAEYELIKCQVAALQDELEGTKKALAASQDDANIAQQNVIEIMGNQEAVQKELEEAKANLMHLQCEAQGDSPSEKGPMYALNLAHQQVLRQRDQLKKEKEAFKKDLAEAKRKEATLKQTVKQLKEQMNESGVQEENVALKEQIVDLNRRLKMGADVYKAKYIECHEVNLKLKKLQETKMMPPSQPDTEQNGTQHSNNTELHISEAQTDSEIEKFRQENENLRDKCLELQTLVDTLSESSPSYVHVSTQPDYEEQEHMEQLAAELQDCRQNEAALKEELLKVAAEKEILGEQQKQLAEQLEQFESQKQDEIEGILQDLQAQLEEEIRSKQSMADEFKQKEQEMRERLESSDSTVAKQMDDIEQLQEKLRQI